ncbi:MAG: tetratricopeptide repeat protein [Rhodospirillaceae bacterium]
MATAFETLSLGLAHHRAGRLPEAEAIYRQVLQADPKNADASHLYGVLAHQIGNYDVAVEAIGWALSLKDDRPDFHNNYGLSLRSLQRFSAAIHHFERALALQPNYADAHNNLGLVLLDEARIEEAAAEFELALEFEPRFPEAYNNLGNVWKERRDLERAVTFYRLALSIDPALSEAISNLANVLKEQGKLDEAVLQYKKVLALRPDYPSARFGLCMAQLPVLYRDQDEIEIRRMAYQDELERLAGYLDYDAGNPREACEAVGSNQPFFLGYQGRNDRDLQAKYGAMIARTMSKCYPEPATLPALVGGGAIRVGFVCGYFRNHSVWKIPLKGWLNGLDRNRFELFCYHTGSQRDAETERAEAAADRFIQGPLTHDLWREMIIADAPHVLIYPEIGMDPMTLKLAAQRLASVQCTSWGHPSTSGLPTIDYYLSSDLMEPTDGQDHYTETLVRLPNLSFCYDKGANPAVTVSRNELGLPSDAMVYWCCQSLYKYLPQDDEMFPRIASAVGPLSRFVFIGHQGGGIVTEQFRQRLSRAFGAYGLVAEDYCVILPCMDSARFVAVGAVCDVYLDSIGWSGINTMLESLINDLPVVTLAGLLMRGRHSEAALRMMGVTETIASSRDDYVAIAARLGSDIAFRKGVRRRLADNKVRVYGDKACITGLEDFLVEAVTARSA